MTDTPATPKQKPSRPKRAPKKDKARWAQKRRTKEAQKDELAAAQEFHRRLLRAGHEDPVIIESLTNVQAYRRQLSRKR